MCRTKLPEALFYCFYTSKKFEWQNGMKSMDKSELYLNMLFELKSIKKNNKVKRHLMLSAKIIDVR